MLKKLQITVDNPENTFIVSDFHFDHDNIIEYCRRPFAGIAAMNATMMKSWRGTVNINSLVFFLGDMSFGRRSRPPRIWLDYLRQYAGRFVYVLGSHDYGIYPEVTPDCYHAVIAGVDGMRLYLVHNPDHAVDGFDWVIHGHSHDTRPLIDTANRRINVSVEATGYKPLRLSETICQL